MRNLDQTVISQYANSPIIDQLAANWGQVIDPEYLFEQFFNLIWNILTAVGYGLDVWGRIVGIGRVLTVDNGPFLGFTGNTGSSGDSLNVGIFYSGEALTSNFSLTDEAYRLLIFAKAAANITDGSIPEINQILLNLFPGRGNCYVQDNNDMSLTYVFQFPLQPFEIAIVTTSGALPTPSGVIPHISLP